MYLLYMDQSLQTCNSGGISHLRTIPRLESKQVSEAPCAAPPPHFWCQCACFLLTMLALFSRIPVSGCLCTPSSFATMRSFLIPLLPPSLRFPLRTPRAGFLSTHSIRPLSPAVIHYCRRRSMSFAGMQMQNQCHH